MQAVDQVVTYFPKHQHEFFLSPNKIVSLTNDVMEENSKLLEDRPLVEQTKHKHIDVMSGSPNNIYKTDVPKKMKVCLKFNYNY